MAIEVKESVELSPETVIGEILALHRDITYISTPHQKKLLNFFIHTVRGSFCPIFLINYSTFHEISLKNR